MSYTALELKRRHFHCSKLMSENIVIAIISSLPPTIVALVSLFKVIDVHKKLNGHLTEWKNDILKATTTPKSEGVKEAEQKSTVPIKLIILAGACALLSGCSSTNITKLVGALAKDPACVAVQITSVYGTVTFVRVGDTNRQVSIGPISVK